VDRKGVDCFEGGERGRGHMAVSSELIIILVDGGRFPIVLHNILCDSD